MWTQALLGNSPLYRQQGSFLCCVEFFFVFSPALPTLMPVCFFVLIRARGFLGAGPWWLVFPCAAGAGSESDAVREETQGDHAAEDLQHPAGDHAGQWRGGEAQLCEKCFFFF